MTSTDTNIADQILDSALALGLKTSWDSVRLVDIADELNITLGDITPHYSQKDDLVEALFDRADQAMLTAIPEPGTELSTEDRIHGVIFIWLDTLAEYKPLIPQMLGYKLEPLHIHLQAQGITRISRTVQWFMEAAKIDTPNPMRAVEEFGLTTIYLTSFLFWMRDRSENQQRTRDLLQSKLSCASKIAGLRSG